jgi:hypothetical protein
MKYGPAIEPTPGVFKHPGIREALLNDIFHNSNFRKPLRKKK